MEILTYATKWVNPEDITLSEMSQSQEDKHCMIPLHEVPEVSNSQRQKWKDGCSRKAEIGII